VEMSRLIRGRYAILLGFIHRRMTGVRHAETPVDHEWVSYWQDPGDPKRLSKHAVDLGLLGAWRDARHSPDGEGPPRRVLLFRG
jgi:hypothetical protein